jgi:site-specific recombinase XerD
MRLREKGGKVADVPMPYELLTILRAAVESEAVACSPDDHVVQNCRSSSVRRTERTNKIVYETVVKVAERAGVKATAHALRRAFAVAFLTSHPGAIESSKHS